MSEGWVGWLVGGWVVMSGVHGSKTCNARDTQRGRRKQLEGGTVKTLQDSKHTDEHGSQGQQETRRAGQKKHRRVSPVDRARSSGATGNAHVTDYTAAVVPLCCRQDLDNLTQFHTDLPPAALIGSCQGVTVC